MLGYGETPTVMKLYEEELFSEQNKPTDLASSSLKQPKLEDSNFNISSISFRDDQGNVIKEPISGERTDLCIECQISREMSNVGVTVAIKGLADGGQTMLLMNCIQDQNPLKFLPGQYEIRLSMVHLGLKYGQYILDVYAKSGLYHLDMIEEFTFTVQENGITNGKFYQKREWMVFEK
jgi:lipopolysaccharide transport system ATP-binding protein